MASTKKHRSMNKQSSYMNEAFPNKEEETAKRSVQRKRKLSDILGFRWSKDELKQFYKAYRTYGKDWRRVAAIVHNRSVEMVKALYTMNRAYLSLPDGTATVDGLIAMMTDYYCTLDGSDSEQESKHGIGTSRKLQKLPRGKYYSNIHKESDKQLLLHSDTDASNSDCLSLLKKRRSHASQPRVVGKRTPRFPVSYSFEKATSEKFISSTKTGRKLKVDGKDDDVAHEVALVLTSVSQSARPSQVSQTTNRSTERVMPSPNQNCARMHVELDLTFAKRVDDEIDGDGAEGTTEIDKRSYLTETDSEFIMEAQKGRGLHGKKLEVDGPENSHLHDTKEAFSRMEDEQKLNSVTGTEIDITDGEVAWKSSQIPRAKSKKVLIDRDEESDVCGLQTLANLSALMQETTVENGTEARLANYQRDRPTDSGMRAKGTLLAPGFQAPTDNVISDSKQESHRSNIKFSRKKHNSLSYRIRKGEAQANTRLSASPVILLKEAKSIKLAENSFCCTDSRREDNESDMPTVQVSMPANVLIKGRSKHKRKPQNLEDFKSDNKILNDQQNISSSLFDDRALNLKEKLSKCLINSGFRRWCAFEWFYNVVDYPWFAKREFVEYLCHVGLGHIPRLTRVEWGVIRSSLGKPRRFSEEFLKEEKAKLHQYRDSVRTHYTELRAGTREGLPTDIARPLSVGQRVIAIHPKIRETHDGNVLAVDHNRCLIKFERPELGVEYVMDIDCMPLNPVENMPSSLVKHIFAADEFFEHFSEFQRVGRSEDLKSKGCMKFSANSKNVDCPSYASSSTYPLSNLLKQPSILTQMPVKEADIQALAELTRVLNKKEALMAELTHMNNGVSGDLKDGDYALKNSEPFKKQYAAVLVQLNEANEQVSSALYRLRQRNTYQNNVSLIWPRPMADASDFGGKLSSSRCTSSHTQNPGSNVDEIVESLRTKARITVDAAMQALSSMKEEETSCKTIEESINYVSKRLPTVNLGAASPGQLTACPENLLPAPAHKLKNASECNKDPIPSELISHCVATLLMIQKCTERQFPPADVVQILNSAVTSLQPRCSQNLPVYAEIQKYMGTIRSQILALIPT